MFGKHGPASASGARTAVASETSGPLRRSLSLLGLLTATLAAGWILGTADAEAEEVSPGGDAVTVDAPVTDTVDLVGDTPATEGPATETEETGEQVESPDLSRVTEGSQTVEDHEVVETARTFEAAESVEARPLTDTVAQTDRETTATAREVSETVTPEVTVDGDDLVEPVQRAVDELTRTVDDRIGRGETPPREGTAPAPASEEDPTTQPEAMEERDDALVDPEHQRSETAVDLVEHVDPTVAEANADTGDTSPLDPRGSIPSGTASASSGAVTGLAGHLPYVGTLIPALAFEDAVRHVLRAVSTAVADEPTFAPD